MKREAPSACRRGTSLSQGDSESNPDSFLGRLKQGKLPIPGQATSILLALRLVYESLREVENLERDLVYALHFLAMQSRHHFDTKRRGGIVWTPLLDEDLTRISIAVRSIFADRWDGG